MGDVFLNLGVVLFVPVVVDGLGQWRGLLHFGDGGEIALVLGAEDQGLESGGRLLDDLRGGAVSSCY